MAPPRPPPCMHCGTADPTDVTPDSVGLRPSERMYECRTCQRRFIVRIVPVPVDDAKT